MKPSRTILAAGAIIAVCGLPQPGWASGTVAGTLIQNTVTATFTTPTGVVTLRSNTNTVKVDQLIGVAVTPLVTAPIPVGNSAAVLSFQVTNTGNGTDSFNLGGMTAVAGNAFTATLQALAIDTNGNAIYDPGIDTVVANGAASPMLAPDGSYRVFVVVAAPLGVTDAQTAQVRLNASSVVGTGTPGTLLIGKGAGGVDAVVGLSGGTANALEGLVASLANVTLTKSALIVDPSGGANPITGAIVTYIIVAHTAGSGTADGLVVADTYPAGTTYVPGTLTLNGIALSDAADSDMGTATSTGIAVALGNVASGSPDRTITFQVKIN